MIEIEWRHFDVPVPSTNTMIEIEYTRHLPATLQFHLGRTIRWFELLSGALLRPERQLVS